MPTATRPLLRTRRITLALGLAYGAIVVALIAAAVTPATDLTGTVLAATALIVASRLAAFALLRREQPVAASQPARP